MKKENILFSVVLTGKLVLLGLFLFLFDPDRLIWGDGVTYLELGKNIFSGLGFSGETSIMPLYPLMAGFLNLFPGGIVLIAVFQAILASAIAFFTYKISVRLLPWQYAFAAGIIVSFEPVISVFHLLVLTETALVFFIVVFIYFFLRYIEEQNVLLLVISAFALAFSVFIKAVTVYLFAVPLVFLVAASRGNILKRVKDAALFLIVITVVFMPWMVRNYKIAGAFKISLHGSENICDYQLPLIYAVENNLSITTHSVMSESKFQELQGRCYAGSDIGNIFTFMKEFPYAFVKANMLSTLSFMTNDGYSTIFQKGDVSLPPHHNFLTPMVFMSSRWRENIARGLNELSPAEALLVLLGKLFWVFIWALAFAGVIKKMRGSSAKTTLFLFFVFLYLYLATILSTSFAVGARLRYPVVPILFIFALAGLRILLSNFSKRNESTS